MNAQGYPTGGDLVFITLSDDLARLPCLPFCKGLHFYGAYLTLDGQPIDLKNVLRKTGQKKVCQEEIPFEVTVSPDQEGIKNLQRWCGSTEEKFEFQVEIIKRKHLPATFKIPAKLVITRIGAKKHIVLQLIPEIMEGNEKEPATASPPNT